MTPKMQNLLNEAVELFSSYHPGRMSNNCDPHCCPDSELNEALRRPIEQIGKEYLVRYYEHGPSHIGEIGDFKHFLPTFARELAAQDEYWDPWFLSQVVTRCSSSEWTNIEREWLIKFFEELGKLPICPKLCRKTVEQLKKINSIDQESML